MKKDQRISRYYDLNDTIPYVPGGSQPVSASAHALVGWWNFNENDVGKKIVDNKANASALTGSYFDTSANYNKP